MKTAKDPRHLKRQAIIKALFAESFTKQEGLPKKAVTILKNQKSLDKKIGKAAPTWPIEKLNKIDLAILRLAVFELEEAKTPPKVVIDEAVELAKEFGSEKSSSFVNGVLGTILKDIKKDENEKTDN